MSDPTTAPTAPEPADEAFAALATHELEEFLLALEEGPSAFRESIRRKWPTSSVFTMSYGLLKFLSDERRSQLHWAALSERAKLSLTSSEIVLRLWKLFEGEEGHAYLTENHRSSWYHRSLLFEWFLGRYDLGGGRRILLERDSFLIRNVHFLLFATMVVVALLHLRSPILSAPIADGHQPWTPLLVLVIYLVALLVQVLSFHRKSPTRMERWVLSAQSLVPRLAAASFAGVVVLASSEELLGFVLRGASVYRLAVLLSASFVYLLLEIARRTHPLPGPNHLLRLGCDVFFTALAHSLAITVCIERALRSILGQPGRMQLDQLANVAAFLLVIGLIVNLIWADEPVTKPL